MGKYQSFPLKLHLNLEAFHFRSAHLHALLMFWTWSLTHGGDFVEAGQALDILKGATVSKVAAHCCINL